MHKPTRFHVHLFTLCLLILGLQACKTDPQTDTTDTVESKETTVVSRLTSEPDRLNPMLTTRSWSLHVAKFIFPTLMSFDPETLELSPQLVKSKPVIETITEGPYAGGNKYTFEIHETAEWASGKPITGNDYVFTLKALFNPQVPSDAYRAYLNVIRDVEVDANNPKRFTVITGEQYIKADEAVGLFIFPEYLYDPDGLMKDILLADLLDAEKAKALSENNEQVAAFAEQFSSQPFSRDPDKLLGAGAYVLEEWRPGEQLTLVKKDNWWGDALREQYPLLTARPKRIVFKFIQDSNAGIALLKNEELDVMQAIPEIQFEEMQKTELLTEKFEFHTPQLLGFTYIGINLRDPKLSDKRVRRALAHVFNVDEIINTVKFGYAERIIGPFHPLKSYYHKDLAPIEFDPEAAKKLLAEAGWTDSNNDGTVDKVINGQRMELELDLSLTSRQSAQDQGLIFQNGAKQAGIKINLATKAAAKLIQDLRTRDFELFSLGAGQDVGPDDPRQIWHTSSDTPSGGNRVGFGNKETDALIDEIRTTLDPTKRAGLYKKFQEILYDEQPYIFNYTTKDRVMVNKRLKGVKMSLVRPRYFENYWYE